jgi:hypothetical protein
LNTGLKKPCWAAAVSIVMPAATTGNRIVRKFMVLILFKNTFRLQSYDNDILYT